MWTISKSRCIQISWRMQFRDEINSRTSREGCGKQQTMNPLLIVKDVTNVFLSKVTHSSGNHAQALALAAKLRGIKAYIVMPEGAPAVKRNAVLGYGTERNYWLFVRTVFLGNCDVEIDKTVVVKEHKLSHVPTMSNHAKKLQNVFNVKQEQHLFIPMILQFCVILINAISLSFEFYYHIVYILFIKYKQTDSHWRTRNSSFRTSRWSSLFRGHNRACWWRWFGNKWDFCFFDSSFC